MKIKIREKRFLKYCYFAIGVALCFIMLPPISTAFAESGGKEKVAASFSSVADNHQEVITVTAQAIAENVEITGIKLPDGRIQDGSEAAYAVCKNGDYRFEVFYKETNPAQEPQTTDTKPDTATDSQAVKVNGKTELASNAHVAETKGSRIFTFAATKVRNQSKVGEQPSIAPQTTKYRVRYQLSDGTVNGRDDDIVIKFDAGTPVPKLPDTPIKTGYRFLAWLEDGTQNEWDFSHIPTGNVTLYAIYIPLSSIGHKVTFEANGGTQASDNFWVGEGMVIRRWPAPQKPGYTFNGWYRDATLQTLWDFDNDTMGAEDMTLYAGYTINSYEVRFVDWNSTQIGQTQTVGYGEGATAPAAPTRPGYTFTGWDKAFGNITQNTVVTALYTPNYSGGGSGGGDDSDSSSEDGNGGGGHASSSVKPGAIGPAGTSLPSYVVSGTWSQNTEGKWSFTMSGSGSSCKNEWAAIYNPYADESKGQSSFDWFRFDKNGFMITGWYTDTDGNMYYLNPASDNTTGRMFTGWNWVPGADGQLRCYYFETETNGTRGALYKNRTIPDGYTVDGTGAWVENGQVVTESVQ